MEFLMKDVSLKLKHLQGQKGGLPPPSFRTDIGLGTERSGGQTLLPDPELPKLEA
jgi:hypothetical protein